MVKKRAGYVWIKGHTTYKKHSGKVIKGKATVTGSTIWVDGHWRKKAKKRTK